MMIYKPYMEEMLNAFAAGTILWMLRAIVWMLRVSMWMLRAIVWMLRATVWTFYGRLFVAALTCRDRHGHEHSQPKP
eukprot:298337-Prorocentrum_minimum.AAC.2